MPRCDVLVVEDDPDLSEMTRELLDCDGFVAVVARDGLEALHVLAAGTRPKLILLDLMMPVMDGWEFRMRQLQDPDIAAIPVIVCSAIESKRTEDFAPAPILRKPLDFGQLSTLVRFFCQPART